MLDTNYIHIRADLISTRPGFLPRSVIIDGNCFLRKHTDLRHYSADNFQNLKMSVYFMRQAGPATHVHIVADVQVEQDSLGQWHGRATVA